MPHARPNRYCCARCAVAGAWPSSSRICLAAQRKRHHRQRDQQRGPQADAQRAPHQVRIARAERLRGQRRHRRHQAHADGECDKEHGRRQRRRRDGLVAEPPDKREIGRHHRDLPELRQRHRHRELQRLGEFIGEMTAGRCSAGAIECGFDFVERGHGARLIPVRAKNMTVTPCSVFVSRGQLAADRHGIGRRNSSAARTLALGGTGRDRTKVFLRARS